VAASTTSGSPRRCRRLHRLAGTTAGSHGRRTLETPTTHMQRLLDSAQARRFSVSRRAATCNSRKQPDRRAVRSESPKLKSRIPIAHHRCTGTLRPSTLRSLARPSDARHAQTLRSLISTGAIISREKIGFRTIATHGADILLTGKSVFARDQSHEEILSAAAAPRPRPTPGCCLGWAKELGCQFRSPRPLPAQRIHARSPTNWACCFGRRCPSTGPSMERPGPTRMPPTS